ncbi:hypothetical protein D3C84_520120 [compost metagenome]
MGEQHGAQHLVFGQLFGLRFDHQHGVFGTGHHHVQTRALQLLVGRVEDVAQLVVVADASGADRAVERNAGNGQGGRGADHRGDVRIGLLVGRHDGADDLHFVHEAFGEQRADRAVDQARGQGFLLARTAFTLEEATRDAAGGVGLFLVVHGQREEALARIGLLGADHGDQHADVVGAYQHGAAGLTGDAARFEGEGRLTELEFLDNRIHGVFLLCVAFGEIGGMAGVGPGSPLRKVKSWKPEAARGHRPYFQLRTPSSRLPAQLRLSDADPDARSARCNELRPCPSGSPAACGAG